MKLENLMHSQEKNLWTLSGITQMLELADKVLKAFILTMLIRIKNNI